MASRIRIVIGVLAITALASASLFAVGCGGGDASERAVAWTVDRPLGPKEIRLTAVIEYCAAEPPRLEPAIIEYSGDRAYIELRHSPEELKEGQNGCLLRLLSTQKTITFERDLDELVLFDASTDPPEQRWPSKLKPGGA